MPPLPITIRESVFIPAPPERVWDYTQDYARRPDWDAVVWEGQLTATKPERTAAVRGPGFRCVFRYGLFDRSRGPMLACLLRLSTRRAMSKARRRIELGLTEPTRPQTRRFASGA